MDVAHYVSADSAQRAASLFVQQESGRLLGGISELPGDKATATAWRDGRVFVVFVQRGDEALPRSAHGV